MEDKILVAIIAALSALVGSLIPQIFTYFKDKSQREFGERKEQRGIQATVYEELLLALQNVMNNGDSGFPRFQEAILKVSLHGDAATSKAALEYFQSLVKRGRELKPNDHAEYQKKILNAMKVQLSLPKVESFEIIRFGQK